MKNRKNGRYGDLKVTKLPQPFFYLYYIRFRDMKNRKNGSDDNKKNKDPPQSFYYLYYIG
jgi:hypothetical protein